MKSETKIFTLFAALIAFQIGWHWFLIWPNHTSEAALRAYLFHNEHSRKGVAGYLDLVLPSVIIGLLMGRIGWQLPFGRLAGHAFVFAVVIVGMSFVYMKLIGNSNAWWWPTADNKVWPFMISNLIKTAVILILCTYGGRVWVTDRMKE